MLRRVRLTDSVRGHRSLLLVAGTGLALAAGAGSASAATIATSAPEAAAAAPTPSVAEVTSFTTAAFHASTPVQHPPVQHQTAAHPVASAHHAGRRPARYVLVRRAAAAHHAAHRPLTWTAVSAELNQATNPAAAAHGIRPAADRLLPVGTSGPQSWVPVSPAQYANATTIVRQALVKHMGIRSAVIAVATAMQESKLLNVDYGTGDSLGLFQQQWDMGWGSPQQIMDPAYASDAFLSALQSYQATNPSWASQPLYMSAQGVQRSGFPYAYAQWEAQAAHLTEQIAMHVR